MTKPIRNLKELNRKKTSLRTKELELKKVITEDYNKLRESFLPRYNNRTTSGKRASVNPSIIRFFLHCITDRLIQKL